MTIFNILEFFVSLFLYNFFYKEPNFIEITERINAIVLLAKWLWRNTSKSNSIWHRIIASKHRSHPFEWLFKGVKDSRWNSWKIISKQLHFYFFHCVMGEEKILIFGKIIGWRRDCFLLCSPNCIIFQFLKMILLMIFCWGLGTCFFFFQVLLCSIQQGNNGGDYSSFFTSGPTLFFLGQAQGKGFCQKGHSTLRSSCPFSFYDRGRCPKLPYSLL